MINYSSSPKRKEQRSMIYIVPLGTSMPIIRTPHVGITPCVFYLFILSRIKFYLLFFLSDCYRYAIHQNSPIRNSVTIFLVFMLYIISTILVGIC